MLILLFTSHSSFVSSVNDAVGAGTYENDVAAGHKAGLATGGGGYSTKSTIGAIYSMIGVTLFVWWGTYLSAEFKGAGQRKRQLWHDARRRARQGLLVLLGIFIFLHRGRPRLLRLGVRRQLQPGRGAVGTAGYAYFSALVASNTASVTFLALLFLGWWLPAL